MMTDNYYEGLVSHENNQIPAKYIAETHLYPNISKKRQYFQHHEYNKQNLKI